MRVGAADAPARIDRRIERPADDGHTTLETAAHFANRPVAPVLRGRGSDGHRLPAASDPFSGQRARGPVSDADRGDPRTRARAYPPSRLPGEPSADICRNAAVL